MSTLRVLVENPDEAQRDGLVQLLRDNGCAAISCPGPRGLETGPCLVVAIGWCPLAEWADVIVHELDLDDPDEGSVIDHLRVSRPEGGIVVTTPLSGVERHADRLEGCTVVPGEPGMLLAEGRRASACDDSVVRCSDSTTSAGPWR